MYSREIDNQILTLSASGWTFKNTFVLFDYETESLWYHLDGSDKLTCIDGPFKDRTLDELPSFFGRWNEWIGTHPASQFLNYP